MNRAFTIGLSLALFGCGADPTARYMLDDVTVSAGDGESWSFDTDDAGALPSGATQFSGSWAVRAEADAPSSPNALCQTAEETFPALQLGTEIYGDVALATRFKPLSGETDQAAGLLFRVQDADNYYVVRANALEGNVAFYIYDDGSRQQMGEDGVVKVQNGVWQELKVVVQSNHFTAYLDGQEALSHDDDSFVAGGVGLWTKADSQTCFDDFVGTAQ